MGQIPRLEFAMSFPVYPSFPSINKLSSEDRTLVMNASRQAAPFLAPRSPAFHTPMLILVLMARASCLVHHALGLNVPGDKGRELAHKQAVEIARFLVWFRAPLCSRAFTDLLP